MMRLLNNLHALCPAASTVAGREVLGILGDSTSIFAPRRENGLFDGNNLAADHEHKHERMANRNSPLNHTPKISGIRPFRVLGKRRAAAKKGSEASVTPRDDQETISISIPHWNN